MVLVPIERMQLSDSTVTGTFDWFRLMRYVTYVKHKSTYEGL
jgi:hypothetical protein